MKIEETLRHLELNGDTENYNKLKDIIDRDIPIDEFQANLITHSRGYGKTYMSYMNAAWNILQQLENRERVDITDGLAYLDPDATTYERKRSWMYGFIDFIEEYYPEINLKQERVNHYVATKETT